MKVAYFTPLNPNKSGIADYNEELLQYLKDYLDIHLFLAGCKPSNKAIRDNFVIFDIKDFERHHAKNRYQACVYHIGNNQQFHEDIYTQALEYSGVVVMHDYAIHHMLAGILLERGKTREYLEEIYYNHGEEGHKQAYKAIKGELQPLWNDSINYPMNKRLIDSAKGIIVHSNFVHDLIKKIRPEVPVQVIPMHCADVLENPHAEKAKARKRLGINQTATMLASFGHIVSTKRIDVILRCLKRLSADCPDFCYYLVGEETNRSPIRGLVNELGLTDKVRFTGYLDLPTFKEYMKAADICLNLRYPVQGETSASMIRLLGMGKAVIVSNTGSFCELPADVVVKINVDETEEDSIVEALQSLLAKPGLVYEFGAKAINYITTNCSLEKSAASYAKFIVEVIQAQGELETTIARKITAEIAGDLSEIGITSEQGSFIQQVAGLLDQIGLR